MYGVSAYIEGEQVGETTWYVRFDCEDINFIKGVLRGLLMLNEKAELRITFVS